MAAEYAVRRAGDEALPRDVAFLHGVLPRETLAAAGRDAERLGACAGELLLARGAIDAETYYRALASAVGARFSPFVRLRFPADPFGGHDPATAAGLGMMMVAGAGGLEIAVAPRGRQVAALLETLAARPAAARRLCFTTPQALLDAILACGRDSLLRGARTGLGRLPAAASARTVIRPWQAAALFAGVAVPTLCGLLGLRPVLLALVFGLGLFFLGVVMLRLAAVVLALSPRRPEPSARPGDGDLPVYTVLVPLYREARLARRLVAALQRIDYPAHRLDIKLVVESDDAGTLAALRRLGLPPRFEIVVVPDAAPKTKPKALCFALALARGSLVTIFDAEDLPEPDQLRRAATRFAAEPDDLACLQARLAWYNWPESWFTRQLAIEYACLFEVFLPALDRLGLPFPLGGTSNHFRLEALKAAGAWDAWNVTEDADLGLRLARAGYRCATLRSTTREEAPVAFGPWLRQRTRWLKGWMQTYLVHMRSPGDLLARLGLVRFLAVQAVFGGVVASAIAHPLFVAVIAVQVLGGEVFINSAGPVGLAVNWLGGANLAIGYLSGYAMALTGLGRRQMWWLIPELALLPVYWLVMSLAAARAIWQLARAPSAWEKTEHGLSRMAPLLPEGPETS